MIPFLFPFSRGLLFPLVALDKIPGLSVDLWHQRSISSLCMLFKICRNLKRPLYSDLPGLFHPVWITRGALSFNNLGFSVVRFNTTQFSYSFIPTVARL